MKIYAVMIAYDNGEAYDLNSNDETCIAYYLQLDAARKKWESLSPTKEILNDYTTWMNEKDQDVFELLEYEPNVNDEPCNAIAYKQYFGDFDGVVEFYVKEIDVIE